MTTKNEVPIKEIDINIKTAGATGYAIVIKADGDAVISQYAPTKASIITALQTLL